MLILLLILGTRARVLDSLHRPRLVSHAPGDSLAIAALVLHAHAFVELEVFETSDLGS